MIKMMSEFFKKIVYYRSFESEFDDSCLELLYNGNIENKNKFCFYFIIGLLSMILLSYLSNFNSIFVQFSFAQNNYENIQGKFNNTSNIDTSCNFNNSSINYIFENADLSKNINSSLVFYNNPYFEFEIQHPHNWKVVDGDTGVAFYSPPNNNSGMIKET